MKLPQISKAFKIRLITYGIIAVVSFIYINPLLTNSRYITKEQVSEATDEEKVNKLEEFAMLGDNVKANALRIISNIKEVHSEEQVEQYNKNKKITFYLVLGFAILIEVLARKNKPGEYENIEHGSSGWADGKEEYTLLNKDHGLILGVGKYLDIDHKLLNKNVLIIGGAGSRKTRGYITPNILQMLGSYVVTDPKGELYDQTAGFMKENGYDVKVFNLINSDASDCYNPLAHVRNNIDVDIITHALMQNTSNPNSNADPFWEQSESALFKACVYYLLEKRPPEERTLINCLSMIRCGSDGDTLEQLMNQLEPTSLGRSNFGTFNLAADKTRAGVLVGLGARLNAFDTPEIASIMGTNDIDLEGLGKKKSILYVITPDSHSTYNFISTMLFGQMLQRLYELADKNGGSLDVPVFFLLDEFANVGRIPDFNQKLSTSRSRKINISIILQSIDQLIDLYKDTYENIIANCDSMLFLGSQAQKTCEYVSKKLGEATITKKTESISSPYNDGKIALVTDTLHGLEVGMGMANPTDASRFSISKSDQTMARALMSPDELSRLDVNLGVLMVKGMKPIKTRKYDQSMHPNMKKAEACPANHNESKIADRKQTVRFDPYVALNNNTSSTMPQLSEEELEEKFDELFNLTE